MVHKLAFSYEFQKSNDPFMPEHCARIKVVFEPGTEEPSTSVYRAMQEIIELKQKTQLYQLDGNHCYISAHLSTKLEVLFASKADAMRYRLHIGL